MYAPEFQFADGFETLVITITSHERFGLLDLQPRLLLHRDEDVRRRVRSLSGTEPVR